MQQETRKTLYFVAIALAAVVIAWEPWRPAPASFDAPSEVGKKLFPKFTDPLAAKSLEVVTYDEDNATISDFRVAQVDGVWSIPSHSNYPADAKEHMAQAATALLDIEIMSVDSNNAGDKELFGVVSPDPKTLQPGAKGVGTRVTLKGDNDAVLADLVIGKAIKDQPNQRYVRQADRDQIYTVALKTDKFSTKFEDWIEKDLLKLNGFDVRELMINDYAAMQVLGANGRPTLGIDGRSRIKLAFDDSKSTWSVISLESFDEKGQAVPDKLADDEELNNEKLNALKTALDDLKIVDVERKPAGLSRDLRVTEEFVGNNEAAQSLAVRGFVPVLRGDAVEIYSSEGEATCTTKDGVRYVLRFGNLAGGGPAAKSDEAEGEQKSDPSLNRYLFVMAQFDESQIPKPQFEPLPGEKPAEAEKNEPDQPEKPSQGADESKSADEPKAAAESQPAAAKPAEKAKPATKKAAPAKVPQKKTAAVEDDAAPAEKAKGSKQKSTAKSAKPKAVEAKTAADDEKADAAPAAEPAKPEATGDEAAPAATDAKADKKDGESNEAAKPETDKDAAAENKPEPTPEEERRVAIERENKRKQDDYDSAVKKGQDKVKELNDRFADWYFIIPNDVYKKIHLGRGDVVRKKEAPVDDKAKAGQPQTELPAKPE